MNPVPGVGPTSKAAATLFTLLHLTHAQFLGPDSGNVGEYRHLFYSVQLESSQKLGLDPYRRQEQILPFADLDFELRTPACQFLAKTDPK